MDEKTIKLMALLKDMMPEVSDGQITEIVREARDEAITEAKAILKGTMVQAILERALSELEGTSQRREERGERGEERDEEQVRQEIEAIRRKLAENGRLLSQMRASATETEEVQEIPVEDEVSAPGGDGYYVYGIVGGDSSQPVEGLPEEGIDPAYPIYALPYQAIQAIVSKVSLREFGQKALEANLNDMEWLETKVYAHQSVLETTLASHTLIPLRFCTIYKSESRVQEILARHYDDFVDALARLEGKQEWGVKVYCDGETLAQRVGESSDRVRELKAEIDEKSSGAAYFLKKKLEETVAEEVERVGDEYAQRSHDRLSSHAEETVVNPLQSKEITGRKEAMILNGAYLVAEERLTAFRAELESLEEECGDLGFSYEMTGPWPPYNFVSTGFEEGVADE
ncbi:MAG: GvpL/GvpF family gas vesicle protein [Chloroflexi bacterium]|nr:GvpL/GvpF family gas vesicle protein [Chloroflexota bacterium]